MSAGQRRFNRGILRGVPGDPQERYWVSRGMLPKTARSLVEAGIHQVADLAGWSHEKLLELPWVGKRSLARLEQLRGSPLPSLKAYWEERGVPPLICHALVRARIDSLEKLGAMTREELLSSRGLGEVALRECERVLGRPLDAAYKAWRELGVASHLAYRLACRSIRTPQELQEKREMALWVIGLSRKELDDCLAAAKRHARDGEVGR